MLLIPVLFNIITFLFFVNIVLAILVVFTERRDPASTWAWLMVLFFIPGLGFIIYLVFGQDVRKHKSFKLKNKNDNNMRKEFLSKIDDGFYQKTVSKQKEDIKNNINILGTEYKNNIIDLVYHNLMCEDSFITFDNEALILNDGKAKFDALIEDIKNAKKYIHLQYYIIRNDYLAKQIIDLLTLRANEGIEVKILYDGMGCLWLPKKIFKSLIKAGGIAKAFLPPLFPAINVRINYRNHRKICVIDGEIGYIGGFNIGAEYLGKVERYGFWRDMHLRLEGTSVYQLQLRFMMDWNHSRDSSLMIDQMYYPSSAKRNGLVKVQIISSGPDTEESAIKNCYFKLMNEAEKSIYFITPYFIPDDSILQALKVAALSGIEVKIIFPANPDHLFVYWASISYLGELLKSGVRCFQYTNGFIHTKMIVVDSTISSIGTANMDIRSFKINFETNAVIFDTQIAEILVHQFFKDMENCEEITYEMYSKRTVSVKVKEAISRLISPIL